MHRALLIDEVLQLVFDYCAELPAAEPKWTFAQLARCCKAWKDPALDRLWVRMSGVAPLLALAKGETVSACFNPCDWSPVDSVRSCIVRRCHALWDAFESP